LEQVVGFVLSMTASPFMTQRTLLEDDGDIGFDYFGPPLERARLP